MKINGKRISRDPVVALKELVDAGRIPQPAYTFTRISGSGDYRYVALMPGGGANGVGVAPTAEEAQREAAQELLRIVLRKLCPTPEKPRFATWKAADKHRSEQQALSKGKPVRMIFQCQCGWYHTSGSKRRRRQRWEH